MLAITRQPVGTNTTEGLSTQLKVQASGAAPLSFQWQRNGVDLPGETDATLTFQEAQPPDSASYQVTITNSFGSIQSQVARLQINSQTATSLPISLTGWNWDMVLENMPGTFAKPFPFDGKFPSMFETGFQGHEDGLPGSRMFTSAVDSGVNFEFQHYTNNNVLLLSSTAQRGVLIRSVASCSAA